MFHSIGGLIQANMLENSVLIRAERLSILYSKKIKKYICNLYMQKKKKKKKKKDFLYFYGKKC